MKCQTPGNDLLSIYFICWYLVSENSVAEVTEVARVVPSGKLLCNVAEHHNLEDYLQHVQATADDLRKQLQEKRVSWTN